MKILRIRNPFLSIILLLVGAVAICSAQDETILKQHEQSRAQAVADLISSGAAEEDAGGMLRPSGILDGQGRQTMESENQDRRAIFALISQKSRVPVDEVARMYASRIPRPMLSANLGYGSCKLLPAKNVDVARLVQYVHQGMNYAMQKKFDFSLKEFQQALLIDKNFLDLNQNIGSAQLALKSYPEAEASFKAEAQLIDCLTPLSDSQLAHFSYFLEVSDKDPAKRKTQQAEQLRAKLPEAKAKVNYNLACVYSLERNKEAGIDSLKKAIQTGFTSRKDLATDPDLAYLRSTPDFRQVMSGISR